MRAFILVFTLATSLSAQMVVVKRRTNITPTLATPTLSPDTGSYSGTQTVTPGLSAGASACQTQDGSTPTASGGSCTNGTLYTSGTITISATTTLKIMAFQAGYNNSAVKSATYTITLTVSDTFTGSAGAISSANWQTFINSPQLDGSGNAVCGTSFNECVARWKTTVDSFPADQYSEMVLTTSTADYSGPMVRVNGSGFGYIARVISGAVEIDKFTAAGTFSILRSNSQCASATISATNTVRLGIVGTTLTAYRNGTAISGCTITDSTYSSGQPGFYENKSSTSSSYTSWAAGSQ